MGKTTGIEWTDHTFNPWIGCTKVSPGCANCYAKMRDDRHMLGPVSHWGPGAPRHVTNAANWRQPVWWANDARKTGIRERVFCASQADIFDAEAPVEARRRLWGLISETCDILDWQILTKRPERIAAVIAEDGMILDFFEATRCWLGVSAENQAAGDERIPLLLRTPAAVRFVSCEPLLGPVDLAWAISRNRLDIGAGFLMRGRFAPGLETLRPLDWVICGGESGPGARPMHPDWARSLRDQCKAAGVPFFFKQSGEWAEVDGGPPNRVFDVDKAHAPIDRMNCVIALDGHTPRTESELRDNVKYRWMSRVGKKAAGCLLDGVEHKAFPVEA